MQINNHFKKIYILLRAIGIQLYQWFVELPRYMQIALLAAVVLLLVVVGNMVTDGPDIPETKDTIRKVELSTVSDLSNKTEALPLSGIVTSVTEATIRAESSGRLTKVYRKLGDYVSAGQIIAEFENSGERAAVMQSQGVFESAKAARDIVMINSQTTTNNLGDAKNNTLNTIISTYTTFDDLVRVKTDTFFTDPRTTNPKLKILTTDSVLAGNLEVQRKEIELLLQARESKNASLTSSDDLIAELDLEIAEAQKVKKYLEDFGSLLNKTIPSGDYNQATLDASKAIMSGARANISATIATLSAAKISLANTLASEKISSSNTQTKSPNIAASDAQVKTAEGAYLAALSRLEKTIVRSPISGTLNSLTIETGDYVTPSAQVAVVSNNGALEVVAYVSSEDARRVKVGSAVMINNNLKGVVTRVAGAIDPVTKKIEVRIGISQNNTNLINGQSVKIQVSDSQVESAVVNNTISGIIKIPLSAVKITPRGSYVFTVSASSTLVSNTVVTGTLLGEYIEITSGLTGDMFIVRDARGLKEGQVVTTENK